MPRPAAVPLRSNLVTGRSAQRSTTLRRPRRCAVIGTTGGSSVRLIARAERHERSVHDRLRAVTTRYFERRWDEPRGDDHAAWGASTWFFEVGSDGRIIRQVERYDNGPTLRYGPDHEEDEYGGLGQGQLEESEDWSAWAISPSEFDVAWASHP